MAEKPEEIVMTEVPSSSLDQYSKDEQVKKTFWDKHKGKLWDTLDLEPSERFTYLKIDWWILSYACLGYFMKTLSQTNLSNAYASGMKEDFGFHGNQYNMASSTMFNIGYIIGQIPSQMILSKVRPSIWLPAMEFTWAVCVMCMAAAPKSQEGIKVIYALRFLLGLFESTAYAGLIGLLGQWYTPNQLGKRSGIFQMSSSASNMFSGYLQAGLHHGMDGRGGLKSYQWLFIFDGILTIPIAVYGFFAVPDAPHTSKAWWLKEDEREVVKANLDKCKRKPRDKLTVTSMKSLLLSWPCWLFSMCFICHVVGLKLYSYMNLWLKSAGFTIAQRNTYPTGGYALQIFCTAILAWTSDIIGKRWPLIVIFCGITSIGCIILTIWPEDNTAAMFTGWYLLFCETGCGILFMSWINEVFSHSAEQRFVCIGVVEALAFTFQAWLPLVIYNTTNAPYFGSGYPVALGLFIAEGFGAMLIAYLVNKESHGFDWVLGRRDNNFKRINFVEDSDDEEDIGVLDKADEISSKKG